MEIRENIFYDCLMANLQIFIISSIGFMLFKFKVVGSAELKNLSKLVEFVFTPCLIFYNFIHVDLFAFGTWLPVCVLNLVVMFLGGGIGYLVQTYYLHDTAYGKLMILACALTHTTSIQISLLESLNHLLGELTDKSTFASALGSSDRGIAYVMIGNFLVTLTRWTVGRNVMENINPNEPDVSHNKSIALDLPLLSRNQVSQNDDKSSVSSKRRPSGFEVAGERTLKVRPSNKEVLNTVSIKTEAPNTLATKSSSILASLKEVMTAPLYAMVAAVIVALFPFLRNAFIDESSFFKIVVTDTCRTIARGFPPMILLVLGANLANAYQSKEASISWKTIWTITLIKLIVMPLIGVPIVLYLMKSGVIQDPVMVFICAVNFTLPSQNNLIVVASKIGDIAKEVSKILFIGYLTVIFTLPVILSIILKEEFIIIASMAQNSVINNS